MSEFVFLYRAPADLLPTSPQDMQERMKLWMAWMKELEAKGHLLSAGHPLETQQGRVVKKGSFTDGPYPETKDIVLGYSLIKAKDLDEAAKLAAGCPMVIGGGLVEIRAVRTIG